MLLYYYCSPGFSDFLRPGKYLVSRYVLTSEELKRIPFIPESLKSIGISNDKK